MNRRAILCLGHAAHDIIYRVRELPQGATKVVAYAVQESGGGMAANAAVAISRLGGRASYWGRVAGDALGRRILDDLAAEGVDVAAARTEPAVRSAPTAILVGDDGERMVCSYPNPALSRDAGWLPLEQLRGFAAVLVDVRWPEGAARVLDAARAQGCPAVLDADVGDREAVLGLAQAAGYVVFSEPGLANVAGPGIPGAQLEWVARQTPGLVGVTLGAEGFLWRQDGRERRVAAPAITAIDTLAAGDVWHGAFTLRLADGAGVAEAAEFANVAAAIKCTRLGGRLGAPSRAEVDAWGSAAGSVAAKASTPE